MEKSGTSAAAVPQAFRPKNGMGESNSGVPHDVLLLGLVDNAAISLVRTEGRDYKSVAFEAALVSFFMDAAGMLGVPKSVAAIYGMCFASPEPLGFSEIQQRLNISAGSISQGLRVLREVGALKLVVTPSARRDRFEPDLELRNLISRFVEQRLSAQLASGRRVLKGIAKKVPVDNGSSKILKARVRTLRTWHDKASAVLPLVKSFLKLA